MDSNLQHQDFYSLRLCRHWASSYEQSLWYHQVRNHNWFIMKTWNYEIFLSELIHRDCGHILTTILCFTDAATISSCLRVNNTWSSFISSFSVWKLFFNSKYEKDEKFRFQLILCVNIENFKQIIKFQETLWFEWLVTIIPEWFSWGGNFPSSCVQRSKLWIILLGPSWFNQDFCKLNYILLQIPSR